MIKKYIINIFLSFALIFVYFINSGYLICQNKYLKNTSLEHIYFNTLISFPDKAFNTSNIKSNYYDKNKVTTKEFCSILESLYLNNFMLVNLLDFIEYTDGQFSYKNTTLPNNKKPIILSFDNVTYISNYQNTGEIDKIIIDRNNNIATYTTKKSIQDRVQYDNEFIVILENFISTHPDFSFNNAKGIIFFSGENGVLGYKTNHKNTQHKFEAKRALQVITKLKTLGWLFGSNNYKYISDITKSDIEFAKELDLWNKEISPLISSTNLYSFPQGILDTSPSKIKMLNSYNFNYFFYNSFDEIPYIENNNIFLPRKFISGNTLRNNHDSLKHLFDAKSIYDYNNRLTLFS